MSSATVESPKRDLAAEGEAHYREWRDGLVSDPAGRALYEEEAATMDAWLEIFDVSQAMGLTPEQRGQRLGLTRRQLARLERRGYDDYPLDTLLGFVRALREGTSTAALGPRTDAAQAAASIGSEG